ncbi:MULTISPECIES: T9SS type A sorting domain-containing protein [Niastella]|uniref:Right-handed parallel beta-helix repeat-containing protein n=1 Tax=Niastella soli TaxID=2821487 RepID=A0ABS3YVV9_9BACT|nr:T9SS type A sorting domain-containing protein [Niastella soli]MBO9202069.1 right-handed parallel beta-helix repeat-containing protein [Niastella soli]
MKVSILRFLNLLLFVATSFCANATNYYIDPSSSGKNLGTYDDPWHDINDIPWTINYFQPGDNVYFRRGQQYTGTLSINSSGRDGAPITFMPYGEGSAPLFKFNPGNFPDPMIYNRVMIRLNQCNYIVIDGFEMTDYTIPDYDRSGTANVGYGVYIYKGPGDGGSHNVIRNCTISRLGAGVNIDGGSDNTITNCTIRNLRMIINTPYQMWDDFGAVGIVVGGSNNTISHNQIHECWSNSYDFNLDGGAIEMYGDVSDNKILYNTASDNIGFMEFGSSWGGHAFNNLVGYNLLVNNGHVCWINSTSVFALDVRNLQLFNNNIVETKSPRLPDVRNLIGIMSTPWVSNVLTMKNNIFWINTSSNITDPNFKPFNGPQLIHQSNIFHLNGGGIGFEPDWSEQNLPKDVEVFANTYSYDPLTWNYDLRPTACAVNWGQWTGIVKDFWGKDVPYSGVPDVGISESNSGLTPARISTASTGLVRIENRDQASSLTLSPNPAKNFVYLKLTGNNFINKEVVLVNMAGAVLQKQKLNNAGSQVQLNVSMLPSGSYAVKLTDTQTGESQSTTFIK